MERITERGYKEIGYEKYEKAVFLHESIENALEKLAEYEDLEEQGLLLRLPCKLGDDFYWISDEEPEHGIKSDVKIFGKIKGIAVMEDGLYIIGEDGDMNKVGSRYALLTREDAERKLKEMEES